MDKRDDLLNRRGLSSVWARAQQEASPEGTFVVITGCEL